MCARVSFAPSYRCDWYSNAAGKGREGEKRKGPRTYAGVLGPGGEAVLIGGVLRLEGFDALLVLEEEDGAVAGGEAAVDLALGRGELVGGHDALEHVQRDLPELLVLVAEEEDRLSTQVGG